MRVLGVGQRGHAFSLVVPTTSAASRAPWVPAVAWAKVVSPTTTSSGAVARCARRTTSPTARAVRASGAQAGGAEADGGLHRHVLEAAVHQLGGARALLRARARRRGAGAAARTRWGCSPAKGRHRVTRCAALLDHEVEGGHDHHVAGSGRLRELRASYSTPDERRGDLHDAGEAVAQLAEQPRPAAAHDRGSRCSVSGHVAAARPQPGPPSMWSMALMTAASGQVEQDERRAAARRRS